MQILEFVSIKIENFPVFFPVSGNYLETGSQQTASTAISKQLNPKYFRGRGVCPVLVGDTLARVLICVLN